MRYHTPATFEEAARIASAAGGITRFLAGGTDVLVQLRAGMVTPDDLIDIKHIPGVSDIAHTADGGWCIGAAVPGAVMRAHAGLVADWPGVVEGMNLVGSTQVQGRATLAGNLCNGSPAADSVPGLVAAGAVAEIVGPGGHRDLPVEDIPTGPGKTALAPGEVVAAIRLPARGANAGDAYQRFIPRTEMDIWGRWRPPRCVWMPPRKRWWARGSRRPRSRRWRPRRAPPADRSTTSAAPPPTGPGWPACSRAALLSKPTKGPAHEPPSRERHRQR